MFWQKNNLFRFYSKTCFCCHYGILEDSILKPSRQSCMGRVWEISLTSFLLVSILKKVQTRLMVKQIGTMSQLSATGHTI